VSLLLVSVLSICVLLPPASNIFILWIVNIALFCFVLFSCCNTQILHNLNPPTTTTTKLATKFFNRCLLCEAQQQQTGSS
jgi:hypothetical protein